MTRCASFLLVGEVPYAQTMVKSLKETHRLPVIQMTDLKTPAVPGVDEVVRLPFRIPLMLYRLKHLANFQHTEMLIVDTDCIAKHPVDDIWEKPFDVALTLRDPGELDTGDGIDRSADMPVNTGVMFSRTTQFWSDAFDWLTHGTEEHQRWYGDQLAVAEIMRRETYDVLKLPCSEFNWAPSHRLDTSPARFWHYKGAIRKKWISNETGHPDFRGVRSP